MLVLNFVQCHVHPWTLFHDHPVNSPWPMISSFNQLFHEKGGFAKRICTENNQKLVALTDRLQDRETLFLDSRNISQDWCSLAKFQRIVQPREISQNGKKKHLMPLDFGDTDLVFPPSYSPHLRLGENVRSGNTRRYFLSLGVTIHMSAKCC